MMELGTALASAEKIDRAIGILAKLLGKLKANPDIAAQKLAQALGEVAKTLQMVANATSDFLSLGIDEGALSKQSKLLLDIDGGGLTTEVVRGSGHCHVISNIYWTYLRKWFDRVFDRNDYAAVEQVFTTLGNADDDLFAALEQVATTLEKEASAALDLVVNGKEPEARARVLGTMSVLRPLRKSIAKTMQTLYSLQGEFVDITRTA